jgi:hypothetical protein
MKNFNSTHGLSICYISKRPFISEAPTVETMCECLGKMDLTRTYDSSVEDCTSITVQYPRALRNGQTHALPAQHYLSGRHVPHVPKI